MTSEPTSKSTMAKLKASPFPAKSTSKKSANYPCSPSDSRHYAPLNLSPLRLVHLSHLFLQGWR